MEAEIRQVFNELNAAIKRQDIQAVELITKTVALIPEKDIDRALNPIHPEVGQAYVQRLRKEVTDSSIDLKKRIENILDLIDLGQIPHAQAKEIIRPVILQAIHENYPIEDIKKLKAYF